MYVRMQDDESLSKSKYHIWKEEIIDSHWAADKFTKQIFTDPRISLKVNEVSRYFFQANTERKSNYNN